MKLKEIRIASGRQQKELAQAIGTDEPMMSRFENYKCLPVPSMMEKLTRELGCTVEDLYEPSEIYLQAEKKPSRTESTKRRVNTYRLSVGLSIESKGLLDEALGACGYKSRAEWMRACLDRLEREYREIKEKDLAHAGKQESKV